MPSISRTLASLSSTTRILAFRISAAVTMALNPSLFALMDLLCREFQRYVQRGHELIHLDWFGQVPEESGLKAFFNVARHCIRTQSNNRNVGGGRIGAKDPERFDAADAG